MNGRLYLGMEYFDIDVDLFLNTRIQIARNVNTKAKRRTIVRIDMISLISLPTSLLSQAINQVQMHTINLQIQTSVVAKGYIKYKI